jgi:hypothetical protein
MGHCVAATVVQPHEIALGMNCKRLKFNSAKAEWDKKAPRKVFTITAHIAFGCWTMHQNGRIKLIDEHSLLFDSFASVRQAIALRDIQQGRHNSVCQGSPFLLVLRCMLSPLILHTFLHTDSSSQSAVAA